MRSMTVDARGGLWLDNPLLVLGLLSLIWVVVATLHSEPWLRRASPEPAGETPLRAPQATLSSESTTVTMVRRVLPVRRLKKRTRPCWQAERRVKRAERVVQIKPRRGAMARAARRAA